MKILIIRTYPSQLNPDSYNVQEIGLALALVRKGHTCGIVMYLESGESYTEKRDDGITIYWIHGRKMLKNGFFPGIYKIMEQYDIVQVHEYDQLQSWMIYTYHNKKHNVVMYHGPYYDDFNKRYNAKCKMFDRLFLPFSGSAKKYVSCITKSPLAADFLKNKGFENVIPIGVGLNPSSFGDDKSVSSSIADNMKTDKVNIIYVGKLEPRRNTIFLLNLIYSLSNNPDTYFTIVGTGEQEYLAKVMPKIQKLENKGALQYVPKAGQKELGTVYRKADILLFPSNYEIYGMVLMEAMYFGTACVSSLNGGSSTIISNNEDGIIIHGFDESEWVQKTAELVSDKTRLAKMKEKAERKIKEHFLWDEIADRFIEVYRKCSKAER